MARGGRAFKFIKDTTCYLKPVHFLTLVHDIAYFPVDREDKELFHKRYALPSTGFLCLEENFATVYAGWNEKGLAVGVFYQEMKQRSVYPEVQKGDSCEFFFHTRQASCSPFINRFCHHFFILLQEVDGVQVGEITRFRTEDAHILCNPSQIFFDVQKSGKQFKLFLKLPAEVLHGYDPQVGEALGFTYRINRYMKASEHFSACSSDFSLEQQPQTWSTLRFIK